MPAANLYSAVKMLHVSCVLMSGMLFALRGGLMAYGSPYANHRVPARVSSVIDTVLLGSAILLTTLIHQYPLIQPWLTAKVILVVVYIVLGVFALRRGKSRMGRIGFLIAALTTYGFIISIALTHDPRGWFRP
jgi:uncharacterized membrane protein SirB2